MHKVTWHMTALPPYMDGSIIYSRWRHCVPHLIMHDCSHLSPHPKWHLDRFSRFCIAHGKESLYFTMGRHFPLKNCSFTWENLDPPSNTWFLGPPHSAFQMHLDRFSCFCTAHGREFLYFTMGHPFRPQKLPLHMRDLDPHLTHGSLGTPESTTQMASWSVQPFLQGSRL